MNAGLDLRVGLAARDGLGAEEQQSPAVERGEREQVERAELAAQHPQELQEPARAGARLPRRLPDDSDRPVDLELLFTRQDSTDGEHVLVNEDGRRDDAHLRRLGDVKNKKKG